MKQENGLRRFPSLAATALCLAAATAGPALAQSSDKDKKDEGLSVKVGGTIFADYTYQNEPKSVDAAGNEYSPSAFNVGRAYINITGRINDMFSFRITPDISRETGTGSSLAGSYDYRLKYAFLQMNLGKWTTKGSWVRFGLQQTPYVDYYEGIYRYRFQGPIFADREGFLTSSDNGISAKFNFGGDYGDVHFGVYNGEGYSKADANNQKAYQIRVGLRPVPKSDALKGLRLAVFYDKDHYVQDAPKERLVADVTFQHPRVNAGFEYLDAKDQPLPTDPEVKSDGWSVFVTPKIWGGLEALLRHDDLKPNKDLDAKKKRDVFGIAYWFPTAKGVSTALLVDYENVKYDNFDPVRQDEKRYALHALMNF